MATPSGRPRGKPSGVPTRGTRELSARRNCPYSYLTALCSIEVVLGGLVRFALIFTVTAVPWLPAAMPANCPRPPTLPPALEPVFSGFEPAQSSDYGLVYVPLDSWIYPAFERLFSLWLCRLRVPGHAAVDTHQLPADSSRDLPEAAGCAAGSKKPGTFFMPWPRNLERTRARPRPAPRFTNVYTPEHVHQGTPDQ